MAAAAPKSGKNLLWTSTTYFGEGLPWSFLHQMALEFLVAIGASGTAGSMTSGLHAATLLKFLWSPGGSGSRRLVRYWYGWIPGKLIDWMASPGRFAIFGS